MSAFYIKIADCFNTDGKSLFCHSMNHAYIISIMLLKKYEYIDIHTYTHNVKLNQLSAKCYNY